MHAYVAILHASWRGRAIRIPCLRTPRMAFLQEGQANLRREPQVCIRDGWLAGCGSISVAAAAANAAAAALLVLWLQLKCSCGSRLMLWLQLKCSCGPRLMPWLRLKCSCGSGLMLWLRLVQRPRLMMCHRLSPCLGQCIIHTTHAHDAEAMAAFRSPPYADGTSERAPPR